MFVEILRILLHADDIEAGARRADGCNRFAQPFCRRYSAEPDQPVAPHPCPGPARHVDAVGNDVHGIADVSVPELELVRGCHREDLAAALAGPVDHGAHCREGWDVLGRDHRRSVFPRPVDHVDGKGIVVHHVEPAACNGTTRPREGTALEIAQAVGSVPAAPR